MTTAGAAAREGPIVTVEIKEVVFLFGRLDEERGTGRASCWQARRHVTARTGRGEERRGVVGVSLALSGDLQVRDRRSGGGPRMACMVAEKSLVHCNLTTMPDADTDTVLLVRFVQLLTETGLLVDKN